MYSNIKQKIEPTFFFYDYETFGLNPALERPAQFSGIRTNLNLDIISEPKTFFCKISYDYLPNPESVLIHGITPQKANYFGISEAEFSKKIYDLFRIPNTCIIGYNNINFDDEFTRNIFYRNFFDPYSWSWENGNSRWDVLKIIKACYAIRPHGILWPKYKDGSPDFRLKKLTKANNIKHINPHDSMSDVYATIAIMKLIKKKQPKLLNYLFKYYKKDKILSLLKINYNNPIVYISNLYKKNTFFNFVFPLFQIPENKNIFITIDLNFNLEKYITLEEKDLYKKFSLNQVIKYIYINKCPVLIPFNKFSQNDLVTFKIKKNFYFNNIFLLKNNYDFRTKIIKIYSKLKKINYNNNVDTQLYKSFFSYNDKRKIQFIQNISPNKLKKIQFSFEDKRIKILLFRYRARNFLETLKISEKNRWNKFCKKNFTKEYIKIYLSKLNKLQKQYKNNLRKNFYILEIKKYLNIILKLNNL